MYKKFFSKENALFIRKEQEIKYKKLKIYKNMVYYWLSKEFYSTIKSAEVVQILKVTAQCLQRCLNSIIGNLFVKIDIYKCWL